MANTPEGGRKASATIKERYGDDFWKRAGKAGGKKQTRGYFGYLKDEGHTRKLKSISRKGNNRRHARPAAEVPDIYKALGITKR